MQIFLQRLAAVVVALASVFGIPSTAFWIYVCASLLFIVWLITTLKEMPQEKGIGKIMPFGRLFFAIPLAVFGTEHFTITATIAALVPRWIPAHTFWVYLVGLGFICAGLSIAVLVEARLAATLVAMTFLIFVLVMDLPGTLAHPHNRFSWALTLRELSFSSGAFAFALSPWSIRRKNALPAQTTSSWIVFPRVFIGIAALFYGVEHFLHPANVPGIPLQQLTPEWIHGRFFVSYFVGVILILAGVCLLVNKKTRVAATALGLTILLAVLWIYLPMLLRAPTDLVALNYFFDTLLFCGTVLLLAGAMRNGAAARADASQKPCAVRQEL